MAEVIGVVASGVSLAQLAGNITSCLIKLKNYWDQVKEAPEEIEYLLREIESFNLILSHIQNDLGPSAVFDNACVQQSLNLCTEGVGVLGSLVQELSYKIDGKSGWRRKVGAAKVVLKKEETKRLKRRMKHAVQLLSLSYQYHMSAMVQLQPDIIVARISDTMSSMLINPDTMSSEVMMKAEHDVAKPFRSPGNTHVLASNSLVARQYEYWVSSPSRLRFVLGSLEYQKQRNTQKGKDWQEINAKYQLPSWFSTRVWKCKALETLSGWRFNLETYRTLPEDSPFFTFVRCGDIASVQDMLSSREALISDRTVGWDDTFRRWMHGRTALHLAAEYAHFELCKLLLSEGADPLALDDMNRTPLHDVTNAAALSAFCDCPPRGNKPWETCRLILNAGADEVLIENVEILKNFNGPSAMFQHLQEQIYPSYNDTALSTRLDIVSTKTNATWHNVPILIRKSLRDGRDLAEAITWTNERGENLLHLFVCAMARGSAAAAFSISSETGYGDLFESSLDQWRELVRDSISTGASIYAVDKEKRTPLDALVESFWSPLFDSYSKNSDKMFRQLESTIRWWLRDLVATGVDLNEYGATEYAIRKQRTEFLGCYCRYYQRLVPERHSQSCTFGFRLISFTYGPEISDWHFWLSDPRDKFAGDFWDLVESFNEEDSDSRAILHIPGSWTEETED